jgi:hypothetical protein
MSVFVGVAVIVVSEVVDPVLQENVFAPEAENVIASCIQATLLLPVTCTVGDGKTVSVTEADCVGQP